MEQYSSGPPIPITLPRFPPNPCMSTHVPLQAACNPLMVWIASHLIRCAYSHLVPAFCVRQDRVVALTLVLSTLLGYCGFQLCRRTHHQCLACSLLLVLLNFAVGRSPVPQPLFAPALSTLVWQPKKALPPLSLFGSDMPHPLGQFSEKATTAEGICYRYYRLQQIATDSLISDTNASASLGVWQCGCGQSQFTLAFPRSSDSKVPVFRTTGPPLTTKHTFG